MPFRPPYHENTRALLTAETAEFAETTVLGVLSVLGGSIECRAGFGVMEVAP
jgi:hypothetical protein